MAYFCEKTGARIIAPGEVGKVLEHDGSPAADAAEEAVRLHIREHFEKRNIGTLADRPPPDAALAAEAARVGVEAFERAKKAAPKPAEKPAGR